MRKLSWVRKKQGDQLIPVTWLCYSEKDKCKLPKSDINFSWTVVGLQVLKVTWRRGSRREPFLPTRCRQTGQMEKIGGLCTVDTNSTYSVGNQQKGRQQAERVQISTCHSRADLFWWMNHGTFVLMHRSYTACPSWTQPTFWNIDEKTLEATNDQPRSTSRVVELR